MLAAAKAHRQALAALKADSRATPIPPGLFALPETSPHAQPALLAALNLHLTSQQRQQGEGAAGNASISLEDLIQILQALQRGKSSGSPYESYQSFWDQLGQELTAVLSKAFPSRAVQLPYQPT